LLLSALEFVDLSLQTLQFQPLGFKALRSTLLGLAALHLQPVGLDAFLTATFALEALRLFSRGLTFRLELGCLFDLGPFRRPLLGRRTRSTCSNSC
jgi:hypothetical protein